MTQTFRDGTLVTIVDVLNSWTAKIAVKPAASHSRKVKAASATVARNNADV